jgi:pyridoxal/pyridoxine/pyridoxamine kinase
VGNKSAVFPLQLLGFDALPLNTVQLATHTGYPVVRGARLSGDDVRALVDGLADNGVLGDVRALLTGYAASPEVLGAVADATRRMARAPFYVMDPVLGDRDAPGGAGRLYVPAAMVEATRAHVRALRPAVLTPNAFEAEALTGCAEIADVPSALAAADALHALGARAVVLTSSWVAGRAPGTMLAVVSAPWADVAGECGEGGAPPLRVAGGGARRGRLWPGGAPRGAGAPPHARFAVEMARLPGAFTGTGDLLAALLLAHALRAGAGGLAGAVERALATTHAVTARTARARASAARAGATAAAVLAAGGDADRAARAQAAAAAELRLVESRDDILAPEIAPAMQAYALE